MMTLDLELVDISPLLGSCLSIIREKAISRQVQLGMDLATDLGTLQVDARKVKQIVYNLLSNAVKFTRDGNVTLHASRVSRDDVGRFDDGWIGNHRLPLAESGFQEFIQIQVTDSGIGISPKGLERLFKPFSQIDTGLARKYEGTGLGLAMVKLLVELHGGAVAVQSTVGEGSRFTIWLPARQYAQESDTWGRTLAEAAAPSALGTAMVVENDFAAAALLRVHLEALGFAVIHAASAEAALVLVATQPLALITLDILLPHMNGWELLKRLKQLPALAQTPVVVISIVAERDKGLELGAAEVMQKPIAARDLTDALVAFGLIRRPSGPRFKVLVVDDDPEAVELLAFHLRGLDTTLLRAHGGQEALDIVRLDPPDLIVLDLLMPEVNGFDVVTSLNAHPETARIPIVVVTSKTVTAEDRETLNRGMTPILGKSTVERQQLVAEVRRAMAAHQMVH
jgi:CheY-like chemotaxis protein